MPLWNRWGDEIQTVAKFAFDVVITAAQSMLTNVKNVVMVILNLFQGDWAQAWNYAKRIVTDNLRIITNFLNRWGIVSTIKSAVSGVKSTMDSAFSGAKDAALGHFRSLKQTIEQILESIRQSINNIVGKIQDAKQSVANLGDSAKNVGGGAVDKAKGAVGRIPGLDTGGYIENGGLARLHQGEMVVPAAQVDRRLEQAGGGGGTQKIKLVVEEDTDLTNARIEEGAEMVIEERERRTQRNSGRNLNPR